MTVLRDKIPVEPLDAERVRRVENNLMSAYAQLEPNVEPARRRFGLRYALPTFALVSAAAAALAFIWLGQRDNFANHVNQPARIATADAPSRLTLNGSTIDMGASTTIELVSTSEGTTVVLQNGRVDCEVEPRKGRAPFIVHAADVRVVVVGTVFSVERDGADVKVAVTRGKVLVERESLKGRAVYVAAQELWIGSTNKKVALAKYTRSTAPTPKTPDATGKPTLSKRTSTMPSALKKTTTRRRKTTRSRATTTKPVATPERPVVTMVGFPAPLSGSVSELRTLALGVGPKSEHAAYSHAFAQRHSRGATLRSTSIYLRRYASGSTYYKHVLWLRISALCKNSVTRACRTAAHSYLSKFSSHDSTRTEQAKAITADQ